MAPNPNVADAFRAMRDLGISEEKVKPVLKNLLKLYDKNWDFIRAENYRVLVDAIFEQEAQVAQPQNTNMDVLPLVDETKKKRPNEDPQVAETRKKHQNADQEEENEEAEMNGEAVRPLKKLCLRYQDSIGTPSSGCPSPRTGVSSKHHQLQTGKSSLALLKPKSEPDDFIPFHSGNAKRRSGGAPDTSHRRKTNCELITSIVDDSSSKVELASTESAEVKLSMSCISIQGRPDFRMPSPEELFKRTEEKCLQSYKFLGPSFSVRQILNELCLCALELGTSSSKNSQEENGTPPDNSSSQLIPIDVVPMAKEPPTPKCPAPTQDSVHVEGSGIFSLSPASDGIGHIDCSSNVEEGIICLPPASNEIGHGTLSVDLTGLDIVVDEDNEQNGEEVDSQNLMVVKNVELTTYVELTPLQTMSSISVVNDISKGLESVVVSVVNEVNDEPPPDFRYIPNNIIFENASVRFSLARLGHGCRCIEDCVSDPCACVDVADGVVYTLGGTLKDDFLEECISMNSRVSLSYCKDCPLERAKLDDAKEGCKGHVVGKFIKECWWKCFCNAKCGNRVVQRGIRSQLQVFMTSKGKGWGLRTLEDLPKGTFVCEFVGEILTCTELYSRVSQTSNTKKYELPTLLDANWSPRHVKDEEALCLDAGCFGNIARFINHRCLDANLVGIPVEVDTSEHHYYRFALFTTRKIDALEELTRDYGTDFDDHGSQFKTFECLCESKYCRNLRRKLRSSNKKRGTPV